jgi:serine protease AprX
MNSGTLIAFMCIMTVCLIRAAAWSGEISPELLSTLEHGRPDDEHAVIIRMKDDIDRGVTGTHAVHLSRRERLNMVVRELRTRTEQSQQPLRGHLDMQKQLGRVKKMRPFWIFNGIAVTASAETIRGLAARPDVAAVAPDRVITASVPTPVSSVSATATGWNLERIRVQPLWNAGFQGQGVVVASIDSGVDINHPDLASNWRGGTNSWFDPHGEHATPADITNGPGSGHGTQTMGIIVGGSSSGSPVGVAPSAQWIAAKIFNDAGSASYSAIHQAFQWLLDPDGDPDTSDAPDVVNCSWDLDNAGTVDAAKEFQPDVQALRAAGIAVVFSAGNAGPLANTSVSPANYPESISVGMTDTMDSVSPQSSRGPSAYDGLSIYPTVVAPGEGIRTTDLWFGSTALSYVTVYGTSFSASHVTGAMALLLSGNPLLTDVQLEDAIKQTSWDLGPAGSDNSYGSGFLDVARAARQLNVLPPVLVGDVDGNGVLDLNDILIELKAVTGLLMSVVELNRVTADGDVFPLGSPDGAITPGDAMTLLRNYVASQ